MKRKIAIEIISFLFILLFVYAAAAKLSDLPKFSFQIGQSPMLAPFDSLIAWAVPVLEIAVAITIAIPGSRLIGLYAAYGLIVMFTSYIIAILNFSDLIPCSCGGVLEKMTWRSHLIFNIVFCLAGLAAIAIYPPDQNDTGKIWDV